MGLTKGHNMWKVVATLALGMALSGCAAGGDPQISYLGMTPAEADEDAAMAMEDVRDAIRHIDSNRVLGAMAFEKVTNAKVDPSRLVKSQH